MIEQLKLIKEWIEVIQSINPSICQLPSRVLLDAADTHVIVSDLIEEMENNKPVINPCDICEPNACENCDGMSEFYRPAPEGENDEFTAIEQGYGFDEAYEELKRLKEQMEDSEPIGRIIEDRTHHLVEIHGYCKAMYGLPIKGRVDLYTHPVPLRELSDDDIERMYTKLHGLTFDDLCGGVSVEHVKQFARTIETYLKGGNNDQLSEKKIESMT